MERAEVETRLWPQHNEDIGARNRIIDAHLDLVHSIAARMIHDYRQHSDYEEIVSFGTMGLVDAAIGFDSGRGIRFETYAAIRVRGAIIDAMRKRDWMPRNVRKRYEQIEQFSTEWRATHGRPPTDAQIAKGLGIRESGVARARRCWLQRGFVSIEWAQEYGGCCVVEQDDHMIPEKALLNKEELSALGKALGMLPERQRQIIRLSFFQGLTLKMIGSVIGVSESRVSQLRSKAIDQLRRAMIDDRDSRHGIRCPGR